VVEGAIPLILPVDWIIARARTGVNVMSDMVVAVMLDAGETHDEVIEASLPPSIHPGEIEEIS
jgi:Na+/H+-dicarboxylate symporter